MLVGVWDEVLEALEDYRAGVVLSSIDYSKAFNCLSFQHCLGAFASKGASTPILCLLATFLSNRTMAVRVGNTWSGKRPVTGGCPQGSILGVFLFNVTTDDLEDDFLRSELGEVDDNYEVLGVEPIWRPTTDPGTDEGSDHGPRTSTPTRAGGSPPRPHEKLSQVLDG